MTAPRADWIVLAPRQPPSADARRALERLLAKADRQAAAGELLDGLFTLAPRSWPVAALTRQHDAGDAADLSWLRADPAHFRLEPGAVRLVACGELGLDAGEARALVATLAPLFGDEGFELSAPHPGRWYLRAFAGNAAPELPALPPPAQALGADLFALWPEDDVHRRWRGLFSQAQILLAQHAVNRARVARGEPAVNGLWFHGAGRLPDRVASALQGVASDEPLLCALADRAAVPRLAAGDRGQWPSGPLLLDLREDNGTGLSALLAARRSGQVRSLDWRSPHGRWLLRRWHAWRFWRRPPTPD